AAALEPDVTIVLYPDHINGFFYSLLPAFCVGIEGSSIGDYGTAAGKLDIPSDLANTCAKSLLDQGIDTALSYRLEADHGAVQSMELLFATHGVPAMIPIFINCAAPPRPPFSRARALGAAVGAWARSIPERVLILGSGGLSHDPPVPALATAPAAVRARMIDGGVLGHRERLGRQEMALREGRLSAARQSELLPIDPEWDRRLLTAFKSGDLSVLAGVDDDEITRIGGRGGHEVRCWIAALAALGDGYSADELFYAPIDAWLTGMGVLIAQPE
ncbi:MAG: 3-carboxyethylcatechol 2,3-dioxygenase, partial [Oricola sp.]|nr:3-carboxyethylcatechol 2,3-dioxygenase [Oricola sp.]